LLELHEKKIESISILPSTVMGDFEVILDGKLIYSKRASGRLPTPGEVEQLLAAQLF